MREKRTASGGSRRDLDAGDAPGMDARAGVVVCGFAALFPGDARRAEAGFEVEALGQGEAFEDGAVGVAGDRPGGRGAA